MLRNASFESLLYQYLGTMNQAVRAGVGTMGLPLLIAILIAFSKAPEFAHRNYSNRFNIRVEARFGLGDRWHVSRALAQINVPEHKRIKGSAGKGQRSLAT